MLMEFSSEEEIALIKQQLLRRSIGAMEGYNRPIVGEVRRVNIVYYLSINGKIEHPHLIRIRVHNNGVRLRDVKRWLSDLRGKDMPESFAWSYKRRYKIGYVWQDLMDDDLITPISDNEYILMGSHIPSSPYHFSTMDETSCGEKSPRQDIDLGAAAQLEVNPALQTETASTKNSPSTDSHDRNTPEDEKQSEIKHEEIFQVEKKRSRRINGVSSKRATRVVRTIMSCGMVESNGTPLLPVGRPERGHRNSSPFRCLTRMLPMCIRGAINGSGARF